MNKNVTCTSKNNSTENSKAVCIHLKCNNEQYDAHTRQ